MIKSAVFYVYPEGTKDRKNHGYSNIQQALAALERILKTLKDTGKTVIFYNVRQGERKEFKA